MIRTSRRATVVTLAVAVVLWLLPAVPAGGTAQHAAGLVIDTGERVVTVYVEFPEETITGEELLRRADVDAVFADYGSMGKAVCSILGVGSPRDDCFREAEENGLYWNYSRAEDGEWQRSSKGVSSTTVEDGDVDGWAWGEQGSEPPYHSFEEIEAEHASQEPPSPSPSASPSPDPTPTATAGSSPEPAVQETADGPGPAIRTSAPAETTTASSEPTTPDADEDTTPEPTVSEVEAPSPRTPSTPTASDSDDVDLVAAEGDPASRGGGMLSLISFLVVMAGLIGAVVWRRRSGSADGPPHP